VKPLPKGAATVAVQPIKAATIREIYLRIIINRWLILNIER
jgi:hypothetical protein